MNTFYYGGQYYPFSQKKEEWERDLIVMKETGLNYIRTGEIVNGWEQLEPEPGVYRFNEMTEFLNLCEKHGLKVLLSTGTNVPPYWLKQIDNDISLLNQKGLRYPSNATYGWTCYNNPLFRNRVTKYLKEFITYFKRHPAVFMYQLNNEIGYPFMSLDNSGKMEVYCYCKYCQAKFREWVKQKYKTLEAVNFAWRWGPTCSYHSNWEQVVPPYTKPTAWASVTRWLDWRLFHMDQITEEMQYENELVKSIDHEHKTITNIFYLKSQDRFGVYNGLDHFKIAQIPDVIGYDLYPGSGDKLENKPEFSSMFLDHARSVAKLSGKELWISETEGGPIGGWIMGPDRNSSPEDIVRYIFEAIGHNAKSALYMCFREMDFMSLNWGGVVDHNGSKTKRTRAAKFLGDFLEKESDFILNSDTGKGKVALLASKSNYIILNGCDQEDEYYQELRGIYTYYWERGYLIDFVAPEHLEDGRAMDYEVIHAPLFAVVDQKTTLNIKKYVENGGVFISSSRLGHFEEHGWHSYPKPGYELSNVMGVSVDEVWAHEVPEIIYNNNVHLGAWHRELLDLDENVEIIAKFDDETPAVTVNNFGEGKAIYFATQPGMAHMKGSKLLDSILTDVLTFLEIYPYAEPIFDGKRNKEIDIHSLKTTERELLIITNYVQKTHKKEFYVDGYKAVTIKLDSTGVKNIKDYFTGKKVKFEEKDNKTVIDFNVKKEYTDIIEIER